MADRGDRKDVRLGVQPPGQTLRRARVIAGADFETRHRMSLRVRGCERGVRRPDPLDPAGEFAPQRRPEENTANLRLDEPPLIVSRLRYGS